MPAYINEHGLLSPLLSAAGIRQWAAAVLPGRLAGTKCDMFALALLLPYSDMQRSARSAAGKRSVSAARGTELLCYVEPFAWAADYHFDVRAELEKMLGIFRASEYGELFSGKWNVFVDNSGLDDRAIAEFCGLGTRGKNGLIINSAYGTRHFIGYAIGDMPKSRELHQTLELLLREGKKNAPFSPCEDCNRCKSACPTGALSYGMDRCVSYMTQSPRDLPEELRSFLGDSLYGCSVCQDVCPHNRALSRSVCDAESYVDPLELFSLSNKQFKRRYGHMGFAWRPARIYKRNALINIGNCGTPGDIDKIQSKIDDGTFIFDAEMLKYWSWAIDRIKNRYYCRYGGSMRRSDEFFKEKIQELKDQGVYRQLPVISGPNNAEITLNGKKVINLSSNNYLGFANHPKLIEATHKGVDTHGAGAGAVRTIVANTDLLEKLEEKLAEFKREEAVVVFQSGFNCNAGTIQAITEKGDLIISDELNHASIIDGVRLSKADKGVFKHSDMADLEKVLKEKRANYRNCLIITDGVFSMDGDIAKLPEIVALAEKYNCMTYVDDAHGSGVLGENGRGTVDHFHLHGKVDFIVGTLSKAIGVVGGYVAGSKLMKEWLLHRGRPILFSTALTPASIAAITASVDLLSSTSEYSDKLWENARYFKAELGKYGFNTGHSETPITPVIIGEEAKSLEFSRNLLANGVFVSAIVFPTVPKGTGRVRCMVTAGHTKEQIDRAVATFAKVGREMGIIS